MTIAEFLEARIAEDEAAAQKGGYHNAGGVFANDNYGCLLVQPARVLAECAAKRAILSHYAETCRWAVHRHCGQPAEYSGMAAGLGDSLRHLAAVYSDHPDYDKDWAL